MKGGSRGKAGGEVYELVVVEGVKTIESKVRHHVGQLVEKTPSLRGDLVSQYGVLWAV